MDSIMLRTSVRDFTDEAVSEGDLEKVLTAAMQAPSARNQQPWEFIVVDDPETIQSLSHIPLRWSGFQGTHGRRVPR